MNEGDNYFIYDALKGLGQFGEILYVPVERRFSSQDDCVITPNSNARPKLSRHTSQVLDRTRGVDDSGLKEAG